jgi:hypothetical protein
LVKIWKGAQKNCIDGGKNRCYAARSESEREDGHQRKGRAFAESASRIAEILPKALDPIRFGTDANHAKV